MAPRPATSQQPPAPGWKYDARARGWYAPAAASYAAATRDQKMSRRQYDKQMGALARGGFTSYEQKAATRKAAGAPRGPGPKHPVIVQRTYHGWTYARTTTLRSALNIIRGLTKHHLVIVDAYGVLVYYDEKKPRWIALGSAREKALWTRATIEADATRYFGSPDQVEEWQVRYRLPDTGKKNADADADEGKGEGKGEDNAGGANG